MGNERAEPKSGAEGGQGKEGDDGASKGSPGGLDPKQLATQRVVGAAKRYNRAHAELVATFDKLTDGTAKRGIRAIMAWQQANGCSPADGKIGPATVEAAKARKGDKGNDKPEHDDGGNKDEAPVNIFANEEPDSADDGPVLENPALLSNITDGAKGMEHRKDDEMQETLDHGGDALQKVAEGVHVLGGGETPWMKAAMAPAILNHLRKGEIGEAAKQLVLLFTPGEAIEGIKYAIEKVGIELAPKVVGWLAKLALGADIAYVGWEWMYEGFKAIHDAHEKGDRDSRIRMYARAYADGFLYGEGADGGKAGAVTPEQKEAVELGLRDGSLTAGRSGPAAEAIGKALLVRYGSADGAKRAIMDALCKEAGQPGIWSK